MRAVAILIAGKVFKCRARGVSGRMAAMVVAGDRLRFRGVGRANRDRGGKVDRHIRDVAPRREAARRDYALADVLTRTAAIIVFSGGQLHLKRRATIVAVTACPDAAFVRFDDSTADRQTRS